MGSLYMDPQPQAWLVPLAWSHRPKVSFSHLDTCIVILLWNWSHRASLCQKICGVHILVAFLQFSMHLHGIDCIKSDIIHHHCLACPLTEPQGIHHQLEVLCNTDWHCKAGMMGWRVVHGASRLTEDFPKVFNLVIGQAFKHFQGFHTLFHGCDWWWLGWSPSVQVHHGVHWQLQYLARTFKFGWIDSHGHWQKLLVNGESGKTNLFWPNKKEVRSWWGHKQQLTWL